MLVLGNGKRHSRILIGTPTKCASSTLEYIFHPDRSPCPVRSVRKRHRCTVPPDLNGCDRVMIVRNPYERLVGMWGYMRTIPWPQLWDRSGGTPPSRSEIQKMSFPQFCAFWLRRRKEWEKLGQPPKYEDWLRNLTEFGRSLSPDFIVDIQYLDQFVNVFLAQRLGFRGKKIEIPVMNQTKKRVATDIAIGGLVAGHPSTSNRIFEKFITADLHTYGYSPHFKRRGVDEKRANEMRRSGVCVVKR